MIPILATVDIGSNAIRMVIVNGESLSSSTSSSTLSSFTLSSSTDKRHLILKKRFALRLGTDVFQIGHIGNEKKAQLYLIFKEVRSIFDEYKVNHYKIIATSAFRDAANHKEVTSYIFNKFKLTVETISGPEEARIISASILKRDLAPPTHSCLLMDIGGGSLEVSVVNDRKIDFTTSLNLGTLRLIQDVRSGQLNKNYPRSLGQIDQIFLDCPEPKNKSLILGTGGNFRRMGRVRKILLEQDEEDIIKSKEIPTLIGKLMDFSINDFESALNIKEEHAPVMIPALLIIQRVLHYWPAQEIYLPKISLTHGLVDELTNELTDKLTDKLTNKLTDKL